jgi:hypothetical protein
VRRFCGAFPELLERSAYANNKIDTGGAFFSCLDEN